MAKDYINTMKQFYQFKDCITKVSYSSTSLDLAADTEKTNYILRIWQAQN